MHRRVEELIRRAGGPSFDGWYVCPHHPHADLSEYRAECDCRKPRPGLLRVAAADHRVNLRRSFMVGDRPTDMAAGHAAGCATIHLRRGAHLAPSIVVVDELPPVKPDHACDDLREAADWIVSVLR